MVFGAGCKSRPMVESMNLRLEADLVQFQNRRYSPDEKRQFLLCGASPAVQRNRKFPEADIFWLQEIFIYRRINMNQRTRIRRLTMAAMMGAVAFVLMYFSFPTPLSPFAELELSSIPELIGGFMLGPAGALEIIAVKILLKIVFKGTSSMYTGELQAFLLSASFVLPAVLYYRSHRTRRGAVVGLALGAVCSIVTAILTNIYLIFPFYMHLYGMNWQAIIDMCSALIPAIHDIPTIVIFSIVPFNVLSRALNAVITLLVYKKISVPLRKFTM